MLVTELEALAPRRVARSRFAVGTKEGSGLALVLLRRSLWIISKVLSQGSNISNLFPVTFLVTRRGPTNLGDSLEFLSGTLIITESPTLMLTGEERLCCWEVMVAFVCINRCRTSQWMSEKTFSWHLA